MSSSQMSGATTSPLKPPHLTVFRVLPGKPESWSVLLAPAWGQGLPATAAGVPARERQI